ncbi:MAG TPA: DNA repair protein RadC [Rudaea sp.]
MTIRDWPLDERPREKLLARGSAALSDAELLALFIGTGRRGQTAVDVGRDLLAQHGGLKALLDLDLATLSQLPGLGAAKASRIAAALELGRRYLASGLQRDNIADPVACVDYLRARIAGYPYEVFICLFLDLRGRAIACEAMFRGTIDGASVHPREVVRRCIALNASAVIFAHNHPSGSSEPSRCDIEITAQLKQALRLIDVRVLDHFVIGSGPPTSFARCGLL